MADYRVLWTNGATDVEVDLIDKVGYLNDYIFSDPDAILPSKGEATNQTNEMVPLTGDWLMMGFDNKLEYKADGSATGKGVVKDIALGNFPKGEFDWVVTKVL